MLNFFRKYEWYFFFVISVFVIISFSFFGTYNTIASNNWKDQVVFTAVDGSQITRSEEQELANFIATDATEAPLYGRVWGVNFLNDGVIRKDFLQTGLAKELMNVYRADIQNDLDKKFAKEKKFKPYTHPQARFISMENAWNYFAPEMTNSYYALNAAQNPTEPDAFAARVNLFLAQTKMPSSTLRQVLRYQEKQYNWIAPDPTLDQADLSLYGYHTLEDWFGPHFNHLISQFIINAAIMAEQKGYAVSDAEVMAELVKNTELSYQQNKNSPYLGVTSPEEYFNEQLRLLNMDKSQAVHVWRQVMLFRRYFQDVGNSALVDALTYQKFNNYANQSVQVDLYRLPADLNLNTEAALQNFEIYVKAVGKPTKDPLGLPTEFFSAKEVAKNYPELVQKQYVVEIAQADKKNLQSKISIKETWNWQLNDQNWATLKKQFPELNVKKDSTREERLAALEGLDDVTRAKVDQFARSAIVDAHPEWISKALDEVKPQNTQLGLRSQGGQAPLKGLASKDKREKLIQLLDNAPIGQVDASLQAYSADGQTYYRLKVISREEGSHVLTFAEANKDGTLDQVRQRVLEKHYETTREQNPTAYQNEDQSWKTFDSVRNAIADQYFDKTVKGLQKVQKSVFAKEGSKDQAASLRFYPYLQQIKEKISKDPAQASQFVRTKEDKPSLANQWRLEKSDYYVERHQANPEIDFAEAFTLTPQQWSKIATPANGAVAFYQVKGKGTSPEAQAAIAKQAQKAHVLLSSEAQRILMRTVLQQIVDKNAISLSYLTSPAAVEDPEPGQQIIAPEF